jgi:hypothetical protein
MMYVCAISLYWLFFLRQSKDERIVIARGNGRLKQQVETVLGSR